MSDFPATIRIATVAGLMLLLPAHAADADRDGPFQTSLRFVTNRAETTSDNPSRAFGGKRGELSFGECTVAYEHPPRTDKWDSLVELLVPDGERSVVRVDALGESELHEALGADPTASIVIFIHGYSYGFARSCRRISDLQVVLGDAARLVLFTWPSNGNPASYRSDEKDLEWSTPAFTDFVRDAIRRHGAGRVKVVAHSLGSRAAIAALETIAGESSAHGPIADLVLIAPDADAEAFSSSIAKLRHAAERITIYVSGGDVALNWSERINGENRLGQGGDERRLFDGVETVDVSDAERYHPLGHEYHYFNPLVVADLVELLAEGRAAAARSNTVQDEADGRRFWALRGSP